MTGNNSNIGFLIHYSVKDLILIFSKINNDILAIDKLLASDIIPVSKLIRVYSAQIRELATSAESNWSTEEYLNCNGIVQEVITQLQIHDLVKQKLNHILIIQNGIIIELSKLKTIENISNTDFLLVFTELVVMNKEQFLIIKKEYSTSVIYILEKIIEIEISIQQMLPASKNHPKHFTNFLNFDKTIDSICQTLSKVISQSKPNDTSFETKELKLKKISKIFTTDIERSVLEKIIYHNIDMPTVIKSDNNDIELF